MDAQCPQWRDGSDSYKTEQLRVIVCSVFPGKAMYSRTADSHEEKELDGYGNKNWFHRQNKVDISV